MGFWNHHDGRLFPASLFGSVFDRRLLLSAFPSPPDNNAVVELNLDIDSQEHLLVLFLLHCARSMMSLVTTGQPFSGAFLGDEMKGRGICLCVGGKATLGGCVPGF